MAAVALLATLCAPAASAAPAETTELREVPASWSSGPIAEPTNTHAHDVISFGRQAWIAGGISEVRLPLVKTSVPQVQQCSKASGCSAQELPVPAGSEDFPEARAIAGRSPTDLWVGGTWHAAANTQAPLIWRNVSGSWQSFSTAGIEGDAEVVDFTFGPDGQVWAMVIEDFDGGTWVVYELHRRRWSQISPMDDPTLPGVCGEDWYSPWWDDMLVVGDRPVLVGSCGGNVIIKQKPNGTWRRLDAGLPTDVDWENAVVVDQQLWVQGTRERFTPVIFRRVRGAWKPVPTDGISGWIQDLELSGTVSRNLWLVGDLRPASYGDSSRAGAWRWTGSRWRLVDPPGGEPIIGSRFVSVAARGYQPAWLVGGRSDTEDWRRKTIIARER